MAVETLPESSSWMVAAQQRVQKYVPPIVTFVLVLVLWELAIRVFDIKQFLLPAPSKIAEIYIAQFQVIYQQGFRTFQNALWGYAIGCGAGIVVALFAARFSSVTQVALPYAIIINSIPIIALAPIANQWFGLVNPGSKIVIVVLLCFFPTMINTVRGLTSASSSTVELMRSYAATELTIFRKLRFPIALPYIFNALKICTTLAMIGAIVSEYFGGPISGLGVNILNNARMSRFPLVWAQIVVASSLGLAFYYVVSLVERVVMPWHISFRYQND
ncbi:MAG: ABC transporter permease [Anaerolineae bacterium]|nr:ABC transporter permease [Anaerolineae bacterium]